MTEKYFIAVSLLPIFLYLRCNCKSYPVILKSLVAESTVVENNMIKTTAKEVEIVKDSTL